MKSWFYAFFMTWGMYLAIPCPVPVWEENARGKMMGCLPVIGLIPGGIWALAAWGLPRLCCPALLQAVILATLPWLTTGFLHLDGFMDVCDAILSRRDLETRQRILKDSHCGAFAVISMVVLGMFSVAAASGDVIPSLPLLAVPVAVRAAAALAVLHLRPMKTSQFSGMEKPGAAVSLWLLAVLLISQVLPCLAGTWSWAPLAATAVYALACGFGYRNLDGMSGDISGFALTLGELAGLLIAGLEG